MIWFFSNHTDTQFLQGFFNEEIKVIRHPYINPLWDMDELRSKCSNEIYVSTMANKLIINGDHSLVSLIVLERALINKQTGFICMEKLNKPCNQKDQRGNIIHRNVLKPVNIRWL